MSSTELAVDIRRLESAVAHLQLHALPSAPAAAHNEELQRALTALQFALQTWHTADALAAASSSAAATMRTATSTNAASASNTAATITATTTDTVLQQYIHFPYPIRDPTDEREVLRLASPSNILELNHLVWRGRRNFALPLRILVAGGGTGDSVVCLAQHLHDLASPASITVVDLSRASLSVCAQRLRRRHLPCTLDGEPFGDADDESTVHVSLMVASLLDIPRLALGGAIDNFFLRIAILLCTVL